MSQRRDESSGPRPDPWADLEDEGAKAPIKPLTRQEAQALSAKNPSVSPWRVIAAQAVVGGVMAALVALITREQGFVWSVLYGAATVVVPGALMARGMTSRLSSLAPGVSAVSFMLWEFAKIGVSVAMLALAPKLVPGLSWPALLVALVVCIKVYWVALLWRGRAKI
ncbi:ATP synthase subunit I [Ideonella paludis]|uniref:ATP synthase subunit I n=1 Tax=Ideonella paludis TaxID=1233411 RepID=A0ABS5DRQ7_9BURK|nr:ATP synthase subunit I [Ideonella paludis]MBQ0933810.1 ATP synthase subunit I [Ideonella paludis]